ncbi:MAG TPA: hypothetical protein VFI00_01990 [Kribbella sp.]|nr:hypothetical protein [Kribbella sp.]
MASVVLVITPISWILLHQPQNDPADASVPIVTRTDDTYITPTTKPVVAPPTPHPSIPPTATPTVTPTQTPTDSATPSDTPSPTGRPTETPTEGSTTTAPTTGPTSPGRTVSTRRPTQPPTTAPPPPPPVADGGMSPDELQLFNLIDNARVNNGCARLEQDPGLANGARSDARGRAKSGSTNSFTGSESTAGGENWSAQQAFNEMMAQSKNTVLNCGLTTLGVGKDTAKFCKGGPDLLGVCFGSKPTRVAWVADFS